MIGPEMETRFGRSPTNDQIPEIIDYFIDRLRLWSMGQLDEEKQAMVRE